MKVVWCSLLLVFLSILPAQAVSKFDVNFNFGPSISQSGNIQDLGDPDLNTGMGFNYYFKPQHGIGFNFTHEYDFEGTSKFPTIKDGSISTFDFHYAFRHVMGKFHLVFEPGIGWQTLYDESNYDMYWGYTYYDDLSTSLIYDYKLFLRYIVSEWDSGVSDSSGSFFLGLGIIQIFSSEDELNGRSISGNRLSALFQAGVGW